MHKKLLIFIIGLISTQALLCFQYAPDIETNYPYEVQESKELVLHLDEQTVHPWVVGSYFQHLPDDDLLAYLNKMGSSIKVFDPNTGKTVQTVPLARYGPDNVGNEPSSFYWLNKDSIFVFSDLNGGRLSLINANGKKLRNYELQSNNDAHFVEISEVAGGIICTDGKLFLGLRVADFNKMPLRSAVLSLDIASGETSYISHPLPVDESLVNRIPIDQRYSSAYLAFNDDQGGLILNFPMADHLLVRDKSGKWSARSAKSIYFDKLVFLERPMVSYGGTTGKYRDEVRFMPRYTGVFFDPYRNVYYRIGRLLYNRDLHLKRKSGDQLKIYQEFSIQVFNADFKKVGENKFFTKGILYEQGAFINEEGLWMLCPQAENEDVMVFKLMELTKTD